MPKDDSTNKRKTYEDNSPAGSTNYVRLGTKPIYAPAIVKSVMRAKEHKRFTENDMAKWTELPLPVVRQILNQFVKDGELHLSINPNHKTTYYFWFSGFKQLKTEADSSK